MEWKPLILPKAGIKFKTTIVNPYTGEKSIKLSYTEQEAINYEAGLRNYPAFVEAQIYTEPYEISYIPEEQTLVRGETEVLSTLRELDLLEPEVAGKPKEPFGNINDWEAGQVRQVGPEYLRVLRMTPQGGYLTEYATGPIKGATVIVPPNTQTLNSLPNVSLDEKCDFLDIFEATFPQEFDITFDRVWSTYNYSEDEPPYSSELYEAVWKDWGPIFSIVWLQYQQGK